PSSSADKWEQYVDTQPTKAPAAPATNAAKPAGVFQRLEDWWKTPTLDLPPLGKGGTHAPGEAAPQPTFSSPQEGLHAIEKGTSIGLLPLLGYGLATAPIATGLGLAGSYLGGKLGGKAGKYVGEKVGAPELGEDVGGTVGTLVGGSAGLKSAKGAAKVRQR